ncbi:hypothetical protein CEE44_03590 [Candidatus Woesearchaeota archaeon B3_Woes]|nr:MAG: hypothetical protein CEE44_03590 [Candidatus Woesearchaeota archaeon B3_Woes]
MVTRKQKLGKSIDQDILNALNSSKNPISTRNLSIKINRAWYSVQTHCLKLQLENKINGFKVTNINVWQSK